MGARLINGNGFGDVTAQVDADFYEGIFGTTTGVLDVGAKMRAEMVNNSPRIYDGVILTKEGRRIQIDYGDHQDFTIPTGTAGTTAYYIIGFKLLTNSDDTQTCETFVRAVTNPADTIEEDMLKDGNAEVYVSVQRITQSGTSNALGERLIPDINTMNRTPIFNTLADIGISSAVGTSGIYNAMPDNSIAILNESDITDLPYSGAHGDVLIIKSDSEHGKIFFYSEAGQHSYQRNMTSAGAWSGGWHIIPDESDIYYQQSEVMELWCAGGGVLTGGKTSIIFGIPLNKRINGTGTAALVASNIVIRQNGGYVMGSAGGGVPINGSGYTYSLTLKPNIMIVQVNRAAGFAGTNNAPVFAQGYVRVRFSA